MSAATLLNELKARGVTVKVEGGNLRLRGVEGSWDDLKDSVLAAKPELIAVLTPPRRWDAQDWRDFYDERVAIAEFNARMPRKQAERAAHLYCRLEWSQRNPPPDRGNGLCVHCSHELDCATSKITTAIGAGFLHPFCKDLYAAERDHLAKAALAEFGIDHTDL